MLSVNLPWQHDQWSHLVHLHGEKKLPHALLLSGSKGIGKQRFAKAFAQLLLCNNPKNNLPCGSCRQCKFNKASTHPDLKYIEPEEKGKQIKVDQIRELVTFLGQTSQQGGYRITILNPAESMNVNSSNALLKSLEEPGVDTLLILLTDTPSRLLPTIRSRCQTVKFSVPPRKDALNWLSPLLSASEDAAQLLDESSGRPVAALELFETDSIDNRRKLGEDFFAMISGRLSPVAIAAQWVDYDLHEILVWLEIKISEVIKGSIAKKSLDANWRKLIGSDVEALYGLCDQVLILKRQLESGLNPNKQLALEQILFETCDIFTGRLKLQ